MGLAAHGCIEFLCIPCRQTQLFAWVYWWLRPCEWVLRVQTLRLVCILVQVVPMHGSQHNPLFTFFFFDELYELYHTVTFYRVLSAGVRWLWCDEKKNFVQRTPPQQWCELATPGTYHFAMSYGETVLDGYASQLVLVIYLHGLGLVHTMHSDLHFFSTLQGHIEKKLSSMCPDYTTMLVWCALPCSAENAFFRSTTGNYATAHFKQKIKPVM